MIQALPLPCVPGRGGRPGRRRLLLSILLLILGAVPAAGRGLPSDLRYEERYRYALGEFAAGREEEAFRELAELDTQALERVRRSPLRAMEKKKLALARQLGKRDPGSLYPLALLHERAYGRYLRGGRFLLAAHSREVTRQLAERVAREDDAGRHRAAELLVGLGGQAHAAHQWSAASGIYSRALALDPALAAARLGLAAIQEKRGRYQEAVASLEALRGLPDRPPETALRLGINLVRVGRRAEGAELLRRTAVPGATAPWVASVATQELARLLARDGRFGEARRLLEEAVRKLPCDPALGVQLAYLEERAGSGAPVPGDAEAWACGPGGPSSRGRYNRFPDAAFADVERRLEEELVERRPALARALERRGWFSR